MWGDYSPLGRYAAAAVCGLLLLAVALVFGQTARHDFIHQYDDADYISENPQVARGFTAQGIVWAFTHFHSNNWHPLTWLSHMLDCQFYGLKHPGGHHLTNVLLHAASAILLFLVLRQMTGDLWPSAFAAALFAIHPLHVESVAWVAERKDVLSGLFFMLTLAAYTGYVRRPFSLLRYLLVTVLFALGLMAKPMLVTLPFVLLLLDYWPLGRVRSRAGTCSGYRAGGREKTRRWRRRPWWLIVEKLPWLVLAAASCVMTYLAQGTAVVDSQRLPLPRGSPMPWFPTSPIWGSSSIRWGWPCSIPIGKAIRTTPLWKIFGSLVLLVGISLAVLACRRKCPYLPVGWLWYLGMLVPVIGLVQVGGQAMADRYTYLTQIGLYMAIAWGAAHVVGSWPYCRWPFAAVSALVVAGLMGCAWQQTSVLARQRDACGPTRWPVPGRIGSPTTTSVLPWPVAGSSKRRSASTRRHWTIEPGFAEAHNNLGLAMAGRGETRTSDQTAEIARFPALTTSEPTRQRRARQTR